MEQNLINKIRIEAYERALNKIDDYFEYRHNSTIDKEFVIGVLDNMTRQIEIKMRQNDN